MKTPQPLLKADGTLVTTEDLLNTQPPSGPSLGLKAYRAMTDPAQQLTKPEGLSPAERVTNAETMRHILTIRALLMEAIRELVNRADAHDVSKLGPPEVDCFTKFTPVLANLTYGSDAYKAALKEMEPALENHYRHNRHHPEFYPNGVADMDLFDVLEMLIDWKAATLRHKDGSIDKSVVINAKRFGMPDALVKLITNTLPKLDEMSKRSRVAVSYPHV